MITPALRAAVSHTYNHRCGYCGVREEDVGSELEIDHFQPRSAGGTMNLRIWSIAAPPVIATKVGYGLLIRPYRRACFIRYKMIYHFI